MNLQILFSIVIFVVFSLVSYDTWHSKKISKVNSLLFALCAFVWLISAFVNLEIIK